MGDIDSEAHQHNILSQYTVRAVIQSLSRAGQSILLIDCYQFMSSLRPAE